VRKNSEIPRNIAKNSKSSMSHTPLEFYKNFTMKIVWL
jgi:hypothetical protein